MLDFLVNMQPLVHLKECAHILLQEPQSKLWLFDKLVTSTLLYGVEIMRTEPS